MSLTQDAIAWMADIEFVKNFVPKTSSQSEMTTFAK
jgi:hypothetical protein